MKQPEHWRWHRETGQGGVPGNGWDYVQIRTGEDWESRGDRIDIAVADLDAFVEFVLAMRDEVQKP